MILFLFSADDLQQMDVETVKCDKKKVKPNSLYFDAKTQICIDVYNNRDISNGKKKNPIFCVQPN